MLTSHHGVIHNTDKRHLQVVIALTTHTEKSQFNAKLLRPTQPEKSLRWAFVVLPKEASDKLPRRGRTTVNGRINGHCFQATLEPDGQLSHWLKIDEELLKTAQVKFGDVVTFEIMPVEQEPEPETPTDLQKALAKCPDALTAWSGITTIARLDWIHWITSAKQAKTRVQRINNTCDMLASGKRRICCFDPSGFYSKAFSAPKAAD